MDIDFTKMPIQELKKFIDSTEVELEKFIEEKVKYIDYQLSKKPPPSAKHRMMLLRDKDHYLMFAMAYGAFKAMTMQCKKIVQYEIGLVSKQLYKDITDEVNKKSS